MSPQPPAHGPDGATPPGAAWVPGEAGVLPHGLAAAARERLAEARGHAGSGEESGASGTATESAGEPGASGTAGAPATPAPGPGSAPTAGQPGLATTVVTAGLAPPAQGEPFLQGPVFAGPYHAAGEIENAPHLYGRMSNPGFDRYEQALGALDGGDSVVFASGMAAATAVLQSLLGPGDLLVAPHDGYPGVMQFAHEHLALRGVGVRMVPTEDEAIRNAARGARVVWIESPANPGLETLELEATIAACRQAGARVVVDNTLATPLRQRPLAAGADVVVSSDSKHLTGHSDLILGHVTVTDADLRDRLRRWRTLTGSIPGPFEVWLAHRSLATLDVRLQRQEEVATAVFAALTGRAELGDVRYPGISSVVGFDLGTIGRATAFLSALELAVEATSFGGLHSTAERRDRFGDGQVGPGYIRFSAGLETPEDIVADLLRALDAAE